MLIIERFDTKLSGLVVKLPSALRPLMATLTFLGEPLIVLSVGFSAYVLSLTFDHPTVQNALLYSLFSFILLTLLKMVLHRPRPRGLIVKNLGINSYSFPSGHAFGTVIFYGQFACLILNYLAPPWNILTVSLIGIAIFLTGVSRVYLKFHYPSDVVAGWILGGLSLGIINLIAY